MNDAILPPTLPKPFPVDRAVGITTTVPVEVIFAAGLVPVDLNNVFVSSADPGALVAAAERAGFPQTCCCWTRGLYGAVGALGLRRVIGVTQGDCSNTHALMEMLRHDGVECIPFDYPYEPSEAAAQDRVRALAERLGPSVRSAEEWRARLAGARRVAAEIDRLTWQEGRVRGLENHLWLVSTSDFASDPDAWRAQAERFAAQTAGRGPVGEGVRLGLVGVPPIVPALYDYVEGCGGAVVFNETQRQFSMPGEANSLAAQYARYTYPYGIVPRMADIARECERRRIDGLIHYVQTFCHRRIEDRILREGVNVPVLTIECDLPGPLSGQLKTRLEAFVQMVDARKRGRTIF